MSTQTQDYGTFVVRAAGVLTNGYIAGNIIGNVTDFTQGGVHLKNQLELYVDFTIGSLTDLQIKIEFSQDSTAFFQEASSAINSGTDTVSLLIHKFTATGKYRLALPIKDRYIKVSAIGTGTVTSSSVAISSVIGVA